MASPARSRRAQNSPSKGDRREAAILDAAEALLEQENLETITVERIARDAGISRGALYFYFGSKQEILVALVSRTVDALLRDADFAVVEENATPSETIERTVKRTEGHWRKHGVLMRTAVESAASIPEVDRLWRTTVDKYAESMSQILIRGGVADNRSPNGAPAVARALGWMTERYFYVAFTGDGDLRGAGRTVRFLYLQAMGLA